MKPTTVYSFKVYTKITGVALLSALIVILCIKHLWLLGLVALVPVTLLGASLHNNILKSATASDNLIEALENDDDTFIPPRQHLHPEITDNLLKIRNLISEKQSIISGQEQFFKEIIEFLHTGIFCILPDGKIKTHNRQTLALLHREMFTHIRQLASQNAPLYKIISEISPGETRQLATATESLLINANTIEINGELLKIITLEDIDTTLSDRDVDSWSRYSSVIVHELKNSLTPITSISRQIINSPEINAQHIKEQIEPIHSCTSYLINFINGLSSLSQLPEPIYSLFNLHSFLKRSAILAAHILQFPIERIKIRCSDTLYAHSDESLLGQAMTNLLKNSIESLSETAAPEIIISGFCNENENIVIDITNNGPEIREDIASRIFIPFFTTKSSGSGIGLPLSRQLIRRCGGTLKVAAITPHPVFRIILP